MTIRMHPLQSTSTTVRDLSSFGRFQNCGGDAQRLPGCQGATHPVHLQVCITIRDIIGRVMVENDWKPSDVAKITETGRRCMNLVLAVFGKERVQPYVFAIELPIQLKLHLARCRKLGNRADTTALNAQNSEHVNKILKEIEHTQSAHVRVVGSDSLEVKDHTESRVFAVFLHEYITKTQALLLDLYTNSELKMFNMADNRILPAANDCSVCALANRTRTPPSATTYGWPT
ncbi:hypothetical protein AAMO2058_000138700 [Amorphochlora amoebiformis]